MLNTIIEDLIKKEETEWLEFKYYWYWDNDSKNLSKGWGEFLKDFSALFNTDSDNSKNKYFIIGFDERTKKCKNYNIDQKGNEISLFSKKTFVRTKVIEKLRSHFKNTPIYQKSHALKNIEEFFDVHELIIDGNTLLVFEISPAPYLLELKTFLQGNESFKEGNVIIRKLKDDDSPENRNATYEEISQLIELAMERQKNNFPNKDISIKKIVDGFKEKYFPSAELNKIACEHNYANGIYFEIYTLSGEYSQQLDFIYFSKYTSQNTTLKHIQQKKYFENGNKKIILTDELNTKKGIIDKNRIELLCKKYWEDVEIFYLEEFALNKLYSNLFDPEIFHQGNFNIKNFIQPFSDESEGKTADILLAEWYKKEESPLLVIKGTGGIGKTTILKFFLDDLYKKKKFLNSMKSEVTRSDTHILFISSHEIINDIMRHSNVKDIFDFYNVVAEKNNISKRFDKKLLELSIDSGNLVIAIDGLDEVIAKMGSKFDVTSFIDGIYANYSHNLERAKIVITCRDYFWDKTTIIHDITSINLKAFNKELATKYFSLFFSGAKLSKALSLADQFAVSKDNQNIYIPYILDMISENLLDDINYDSIHSKMLKPNISKNDYLVGKVCEREIIKLENLSIDNQIKIFIVIATKFNGVLHYTHLDSMKDLFDIEFTHNTIEKFKGHPLLVHDEKSETLKFRYDFFKEYFKNIYLSTFIESNAFNGINSYLIDIMIDHINYDNSFTKMIRNRIEEINLEDLKFSVFDFLQNSINEVPNLSDNNKKRLNSSLFILLLVLNPNNTTHERTSLLKEIYESKSNQIKNLSIINLHSSFSDKPIFDFRGLEFDNCHFENYEYFAECKCDNYTYFRTSTFIAPLFREAIKPNFSTNNFDFVSCNDLAGVLDLLKEQDRIAQHKDNNIRKDIKRIIGFFWSNGAFKQKLESETRKKLKNHTFLLDKLVKQKILLNKTIHTKQKRADQAYLINPEYSNLRKILEENESCYEFEKVIKML